MWDRIIDAFFYIMLISTPILVIMQINYLMRLGDENGND